MLPERRVPREAFLIFLSAGCSLSGVRSREARFLSCLRSPSGVCLRVPRQREARSLSGVRSLQVARSL